MPHYTSFEQCLLFFGRHGITYSSATTSNSLSDTTTSSSNLDLRFATVMTATTSDPPKRNEALNLYMYSCLMDLIWMILITEWYRLAWMRMPLKSVPKTLNKIQKLVESNYITVKLVQYYRETRAILVCNIFMFVFSRKECNLFLVKCFLPVF